MEMSGQVYALAALTLVNIHRVQGWEGHRTCLNGVKKRNISCLCQESNTIRRSSIL
jgi:hypothetical protein